MIAKKAIAQSSNLKLLRLLLCGQPLTCLPPLSSDRNHFGSLLNRTGYHVSFVITSKLRPM
ncbi:MAG: hypothetical protein HXY43_17055 [Fischerella sp.]|uniref:hypothetical protein n=1 Tax=unclassified Fischerella TaxID=494603 RepID=UPI0012DFB6DB|nr:MULTISPECIES: hypothetical protein [unclassified Fischerella]NWF60915.1 hypothetical protein [Fischerella sp.]